MKNNTTENNFFYFIIRGSYLICDLDCCEKSKRTFDIKLFDLANSKKLLNLLKLYYIEGGFGNTYTYERRGYWFCGYLKQFGLTKIQYEKLKTNPTVRILIEDKSLLKFINVT